MLKCCRLFPVRVFHVVIRQLQSFVDYVLRCVSLPIQPSLMLVCHDVVCHSLQWPIVLVSLAWLLPDATELTVPFRQSLIRVHLMPVVRQA